MKASGIKWTNNSTYTQVVELLDNREYFADVENAVIENGPFSGESLQALAVELDSTFYNNDVDWSLVDWQQAANVVNFNISVVGGSK